MKETRLVLKQSSGWFAAGREFAQALTLLSDGAFKLYVYACLHADRHTGCLRMQMPRMTRVLQRTQQILMQQLMELRDCAVCEVTLDEVAAEVLLEVRDRFLPYQKQRTEQQGSASAAEFVHAVRDFFLAHSCVQSCFTPADENVAVHLYRRGISLQQIQRGILLGCARKYLSMMNRGIRQPVTSLQYFVATVDEVIETAIPESYWEPLRRKVVRMEQA